MAVTKIHPIKSTLKKALDYIENPAKTDEKMLVSSFACSYETADIEFELLFSQTMQKGNNLAHLVAVQIDGGGAQLLAFLDGGGDAPHSLFWPATS